MELLEIFFSGYPRMIGLNYFTHLKKLIIMNQQLQKIDGLMPLTKLTELWLCECDLKVGGCSPEKRGMDMKFFLIYFSVKFLEDGTYDRNWLNEVILMIIYNI